MADILLTTPLAKVSVSMVARNCGVSPRTVYNYFADKLEIAAAIYTDAMLPHLGDPLDVWYAHATCHLIENMDLYRNAFSYHGQNSIIETIASLDFKKLELHVLPEVRADEALLDRVTVAQEFMVYANLASLVMGFSNLRGRRINAIRWARYDSAWDFLSDNMPPVLHGTLSMTVV